VFSEITPQALNFPTQACKTLTSTINGITIWRNALLEYAALAPLSFCFFIQSEDSIQPFTIRVHKARNPTNSLADKKSTQCFIVRGRNYLLTDGDNCIVDLWDLGYSPRAVIQPFPVCSTVKYDSVVVTILDIQPSADGRGIRPPPSHL
jgi:hypothetical protein